MTVKQAIVTKLHTFTIGATSKQAKDDSWLLLLAISFGWIMDGLRLIEQGKTTFSIQARRHFFALRLLISPRKQLSIEQASEQRMHAR
jgi:hypothetical protein